jgi:hypothetical protein
MRVRVLVTGTGEVLQQRTFPIRFTFVGPIPGPETCFSYGPSQLALVYMKPPPEPPQEAGFILLATNVSVAAYGFPEQQRLLALARSHNLYGVAGPDHYVYGTGHEFSYWNGPATTPAIPGESCTGYDPIRHRLRPYTGGDWHGFELTDGSRKVAQAGAMPARPNGPWPSPASTPRCAPCAASRTRSSTGADRAVSAALCRISLGGGPVAPRCGTRL